MPDITCLLPIEREPGPSFYKTSKLINVKQPWGRQTKHSWQRAEDTADPHIKTVTSEKDYIDIFHWEMEGGWLLHCLFQGLLVLKCSVKSSSAPLSSSVTEIAIYLFRSTCSGFQDYRSCPLLPPLLSPPYITAFYNLALEANLCWKGEVLEPLVHIPLCLLSSTPPTSSIIAYTHLSGQDHF